MERERTKQLQEKAGRKIVLFPIPLQGHLTPMLHLATLLHSKGFSITIILTHYNSLNPIHFPDFTFHLLQDGLPEHSVVSSMDPTTVLSALNTNCTQQFQDCLSQILRAAAAEKERVVCLISDPMWSFAGSVAESFNLPRIAVRTGSIPAFLVYDALPSLRELGYFPLQEAELDKPLQELPPLRVRELPAEAQHWILATIVEQTKTSQAVICNTFEELEDSSLARMRQVLNVPLFAIGPAHKYSPTPAASLWTQDQTCISWLNKQASKSVLYVSFGSIAALSEGEFLEVAWGLANSEQPFLWVVRPGLSQGSEVNELLPEGYLETVKDRGYIVKWAPQLEVLSHPAVGGFWTHCGWNSMIETICEGVPMLCLPFFGDQTITARHVCDRWKIGLQLEKPMKKEDIKKAITRLMMEEGGSEMRNRITVLKEKSNVCLKEGGSSYKSLKSLTSYLLSL